MDTNTVITITLPCNHTYIKNSFISMVINQICLYKKVYCIECQQNYKTNQTEIIRNIYLLIQSEKKEIKKSLNNKFLNLNEKQTLIKYRKDFYLYLINNIKEKIEYIDILLEMFNIMFDTIYFI